MKFHYATPKFNKKINEAKFNVYVCVLERSAPQGNYHHRSSEGAE